MTTKVMNNSMFKSMMRIILIVVYYHQHKNCMLYRAGRKEVCAD